MFQHNLVSNACVVITDRDLVPLVNISYCVGAYLTKRATRDSSVLGLILTGFKRNESDQR